MASSARNDSAPTPRDLEHEVLLLWTQRQLWGGRGLFAGLAFFGCLYAMLNLSQWFVLPLIVCGYLGAVCAQRVGAIQLRYLRVFSQAQQRLGYPRWVRIRPRAFLHERGVSLAPSEVSDPVIAVLRRAPAQVLAGVALAAAVIRVIVLLKS